MSNINDVAEQAGVSAMTVSRYFNEPSAVAPSTKARVEEAVEAVQYVPNAAARSLVQGETRTVAAILSDITNPFFTKLARGAEDVAREEEYTLFIGNTDESLAKEKHYIDTLISRQTDGLLLSPSGDNEHLDELHQHDIPFILIDRKIQDARADVVRGDSFSGGVQLTEHLVEQGYREVAFIGGKPDVSSLQDRLAGYRSVMEDARLEPQVVLGEYTRESGEQILEGLIEEGAIPKAIVAANNLVAVGALRALRRHDYQVPRDVALVCFEDMEVAAMMDPFLTVADQPSYEMGRAAMQMLLDRMHGGAAPPREKVFPVELVVRRSSKKPAS